MSDAQKALKKAKQQKKTSKLSQEELQSKREEYKLKRDYYAKQKEDFQAAKEAKEEADENRESYIKEEKDRYECLMNVLKKDKQNILVDFVEKDREYREMFFNLAMFLLNHQQLDSFLQDVGLVSTNKHASMTNKLMKDAYRAYEKPKVTLDNMDYLDNNSIVSMLDFIRMNLAEEYASDLLEKYGKLSTLIKEEKQNFAAITESFLSTQEKQMLANLLNRGQQLSYVDEQKARLYCLKEVYELLLNENKKEFKEVLKRVKEVLKRFMLSGMDRELFVDLVDFLSKHETPNNKSFVEYLLRRIGTLPDKKGVVKLKLEDVNADTNIILSILDFIKDRAFELYEQEAAKYHLGDLHSLIELEKEKFGKDKVEEKPKETVSEDIGQQEWDELFGYVGTNKPRRFEPVKGKHAPPRDDTIMYTPTVRDCVRNYQNKPWIYHYDGSMYIRMLEGDVFKGYLLPEKVKFESNEYQRVTPSFDLLLCNAGNKQQKGNTFSFTYKGKNYKMEILYGIRDADYEFLLQGEDLYDEEKEWVHSQQVLEVNYLERFLSTQLTGMYEEAVRGHIRNMIEGLVTDNGVTKRYFQRADAVKIEKAIYDKLRSEKRDGYVRVRDYLDRVGRLMIFLDNNYMKKDATTFINRLEKSYYNADAISNLILKDIFPEIYGKGDDESIRYLENKVNNEVRTFVMIEGRNLESSISRRPRSITIRPLRLGTVYTNTEMLTKSDCVNIEDIKSERLWDIVFYPEEDKIYCFKLLNLVEQFLNGDYVNKKTGNKFDDDFVTEISVTYQIPPKVEDKKVEVKKDVEKNPLLEAIHEVERGMSKEDKKYYDMIFNGKHKDEDDEDVMLGSHTQNVQFDIPSAQYTLLTQINQLEKELKNEYDPARKNEIGHMIWSRKEQIQQLEKRR